MKYNTKSYQHSEDEPNINNNSSSSPVDEKRLLLKKSYVKQNRKEKRIEKNACTILPDNQFKSKWVYGPLRSKQFERQQHVIPGLLSGFNSEGKEISSPQLLMISNTPVHKLGLEESSATSVGAWVGYENFRAAAGIAGGGDIVQYIKTHPFNSFTRELGGKTYEFKVKQLFNLQENKVLGFSLITGKWRNEYWGFIKWFDGNWQCQVSSLYSFKLGNEDISYEYLRQISGVNETLREDGATVASIGNISEVMREDGATVATIGGARGEPIVRADGASVATIGGATKVPQEGIGTATVGVGTGMSACRLTHNGFLNMYGSTARSSFFHNFNRIPGILSSYDPSESIEIMDNFPVGGWLESSVTLRAPQWELPGNSGFTKTEIIIENPIITWNTNVGGQNFTIKIAQMYDFNQLIISGSNNPDILGFRLIVGIPKNKKGEKFGYIQWYKNSFNCPVSPVYMFKLGSEKDISGRYLDIHNQLMHAMMNNAEALRRSVAGDFTLAGAGSGPGEAPTAVDIDVPNEAEAMEDIDEEELELTPAERKAAERAVAAQRAKDQERAAAEGAAKLRGAGRGTGKAPACPKHCIDPHSDAWWTNTEEVLWKNVEHQKEAASLLRSEIKMYSGQDTEHILGRIHYTYSIENANKAGKRIYENKDIKVAIMRAVLRTYEEMKYDVSKKLKLSSKNLLREHWLRKLMRYITDEYLRTHFEYVLEDGAKTIEIMSPQFSNLPYEPKKSAIEQIIDVSIEKAKHIFSLLSEHLDTLRIIWDSGGYGGSMLYSSVVLEPLINTFLKKYKTSILKQYGLDEPPVATGSAVEVAREDNDNHGPFGGMTFKEEEMLFFKRNAKKIMVAIIKDTPFPAEVLDELKEQGAPPDLEQNFNDAVNEELKRDAGDNAPVIDINTSKMSELFHAYSIIERDNVTRFQDRMNQVMAYLAIHMAGDEEWIIEQFKEIQDSRYKDTRIVKFAVQFIKKLADTIETEQEIEQEIEQKIELDVEQVEKIGEAINETETPSETPPEDIESAQEEVRQECKNESDGLNAQIEELREDLQKERDKIKQKDDMIKYGAIGAGVVIVLLILFLLMR